MSDVNYLNTAPEEPDWLAEAWPSQEPPEGLDMLPDLGSVPDDFFSTELDLSWHEPPDDFLPLPTMVGMSQEALEMPFGFVPSEGPELPDLDEEALAAEVVAMPLSEIPRPEPEQDRPLDTGPVMQNPDVLAASAAPSLWERYTDAFLAGRTPGGNEEALLERANILNLQDAQFLGRSDEEGHHVSAIEVYQYPATGERYGSVLDVATFQDVQQAEAFYAQLQGPVDDNSLPNYAVANLASFAAGEQGIPLNWRPATEQDLAAYAPQQDVQASLDEPPQEIVDDPNQEFAWLDPAIFQQESQLDYARDGLEDLDRESLDYGVRMGQNEYGHSTVELIKEWDGGLRSGGGEESRLIGAYESPDDAQAVAQDLWQVQQDVQDLTGDRVAGWQAMGSLGYEIASANGTLQGGEPLFMNLDGGPAEPFEFVPTQDLFAQYAAMQQEQSVQEPVFDPAVRVPAYQEIDL